MHEKRPALACIVSAARMSFSTTDNLLVVSSAERSFTERMIRSPQTERAATEDLLMPQITLHQLGWRCLQRTFRVSPRPQSCSRSRNRDRVLFFLVISIAMPILSAFVLFPDDDGVPRPTHQID